MKRWKLKDQQDDKVLDLPEYPRLILQLLAIRGTNEPEKIEEFLHPDYEKLHSPFLFRDMEKAVARIARALEEKEKIFIYADYDADALTAAAVVFRSLQKLGTTPACYIPDRFSEGYGISKQGLEKIKAGGGKLVITVDCGTNAVIETEFAESLGLELIITDHHEITGELPQAFALINPKNEADNYPFLHLTGVGVAFKLAQALFQKLKAQSSKLKIAEGWEKWLLDLVAIGTVADCQSLTGENRILVSFGLKVLGKTRWPGLRALLESSGIGERFDTYTVGFVLAPRINAAGRILHAGTAFDLLVADNKTEAGRLAQELNKLNVHRQTITDQILSEASNQAEMILDKKILLVSDNDWPKGVIGLVAGRLLEKYNRPSLVLEKTEEQATGSARSGNGFDIVAGLAHAREFLTRFGGHRQAAGFSLPAAKIDLFYAKLLEYAESIDFEPEEPELVIDCELEPQDISWENYEFLEKFAPFGIGNPKPRFLGRNLAVENARIVGADGKHLKLVLIWQNRRLEAIAFNQGFHLNNLPAGRKLDIVFELDANEYNGRKDLQLKVVDLRIDEESRRG